MATMTGIPRLTTRGIRTAEHIRDRKPFTTSGSLVGEAYGCGTYRTGRLSGADLDRFSEDAPNIRYAVFSYATPIAWWTEEKGWHFVDQRFSLTTTKHQGNLYLAKNAD